MAKRQQFERTDRIAAEIMREAERIIREDVSDPRTDCMFSITHVDVTRDLRYAKVFISIYEEDKRAPMMIAPSMPASMTSFSVTAPTPLWIVRTRTSLLESFSSDCLTASTEP